MSAAIWHDVECGSYAADLPLWEELAQTAGGPVLELGCGTGRVALHLARRGHEVVGLDSDPELIAALRERAEGLPVEALAADARDFSLEEPVALVLAPMQFLQLLGDSEERLACLRCIAACLRPGGAVAAALVEEMPEPDGAAPPLPDVREVDGWVYSSLPTEAALAAGEIRLRRLRQTVSPGGELSEEPNEIRLRTFPAHQLEAEAAQVGLRAGQRRSIAYTEAHVGSVVSILEGAG
ncbi:MAG TPA: class I SAM-dependent methyltransferase [Solirubrobacterales bacterium]|nr:class I SAM-dependent methyltransferase [Solirubrobacterales bacterium]